MADAGWVAARIADHLGCNDRTALNLLNDFRDRGREALSPRRPGPAPDTARRDQVAGRIRDLLGQDRTGIPPNSPTPCETGALPSPHVRSDATRAA